ncbi:hypothetical protein [Nocardioides sp. URHA0032]|uniref:hypothetical protein n=1 Tax=Nocardioides sp. URHA0032 TaxID=1380388 RepID=UPI00048F1474|nr:hypothetical protein [Nocardioides sp. URHA0032]
MSAEVLRQAATRVRHDVEFGQAHGDDSFLIAVADWLDFAAAGRGALDMVAAHNGRPLNTDGSQLFRDMEQRALTVARAYLGSDA